MARPLSTNAPDGLGALAAAAPLATTIAEIIGVSFRPRAKMSALADSVWVALTRDYTSIPRKFPR